MIKAIFDKGEKSSQHKTDKADPEEIERELEELTKFILERSEERRHKKKAKLSITKKEFASTTN